MEEFDVSTVGESVKALSLNDLSKCGLEESSNCTYLDENLLESDHLSFNEAEMRAALMQQTIDLYTQYAQETYPKDTVKQSELISEMQEQYFNYYIKEVYQYQVLHQQQQNEQFRLIQTKEDCDNKDSHIPQPLPLVPATIWTRKNINEFKKEVLETQRECCIKIGSLATATIRVPTTLHGKSICWEFATDSYDLGFGLYFEWDLEPPENISVNISESSDEEGYDDDDNDEADLEKDVDHKNSLIVKKNVDSEKDSNLSYDLEGGKKLSLPRLPTDELIPIYRRDCHQNIYCGTHQYPGVGVYVFKFDNSFSLWRSKWLYYRIYYKS